jgi:hypothetical protein
MKAGKFQSVVVDDDATGNSLGIDIDNASRKVALNKFSLTEPAAVIERT